ncbi:hypothetical protein Csa_006116, partial [Cucumis sativus]
MVKLSRPEALFFSKEKMESFLFREGSYQERLNFKANRMPNKTMNIGAAYSVALLQRLSKEPLKFLVLFKKHRLFLKLSC